MPEIRHVTTRRSFITGMGFGAVGLYGVWAAYGAAPLPFAEHHQGHPDGEAFGSHDGGSHEEAVSGPVMSPETFRREHAAFINRFKRPDGSVEPVAETMMHHDMSHHDMASMEHMDHGGDHSNDHGSDHGGAASPPIDLYLLAFKWGYNPDTLRLRTGVRYRLRLMADDITHGASLQLGAASRIIRLRPDVVGEQSLTFTESSTVLVYCTVYCGQGHDRMQGKIIVSGPERGGLS